MYLNGRNFRGWEGSKWANFVDEQFSDKQFAHFDPIFRPFFFQIFLKFLPQKFLPLRYYILYTKKTL